MEGLCSCQGADQQGLLQQVTFKQGPEQGELRSLADTRAKSFQAEKGRGKLRRWRSLACGWEEGRGGRALWDKK